MDTKADEARARRVARRVANGDFTDIDGRRHGRYRAVKSRWHAGSGDNLGGFQIIDIYTNTIVAGERFDMSADQVIAYFGDTE